MHKKFWENIILAGHPRKGKILRTLSDMRPSDYFRRFKGRFKGVEYDCDESEPRIFRNNWPDGVTSTGQTAEEWAGGKIQEDLSSGAVRCLGKVGEVEPPYVVLPLTVEMKKPRLITDARYINLWCEARGFTLDSVSMVPETFRQDTFLANYDHKSGYHAFLFNEEEQKYFGFEIGGYYYVFVAGCFGWNCMPEIYHVAHMAMLDFVKKEFGIPSLGYLDGALTGSMWGELLEFAKEEGGGEEARRASAAYGIDVLMYVGKFPSGLYGFYQ